MNNVMAYVQIVASIYILYVVFCLTPHTKGAVVTFRVVPIILSTIMILSAIKSLGVLAFL